MIDQEKLDREYVETLELQIDELGTKLRDANRSLDRYREENLELQNQLEGADREIDTLRVCNVRMRGAIDEATRLLSNSLWTPRRSGAEAE